MMRCLLLLLLVLLAVCHSLPTNSLSRQKRGFRVNSASRVAHGYGKRQFSSWSQGSLKSPASGGLMTVQELADLASGNPSLIEALIEKFIDIDGDRMVSSQELFGVDAQ